jgi:uncharacterized protein (DUF4415 family)
MKQNDDDTRKRLLAEDDAPPWTDEMFDRAEIRHGDIIIRPATGTVAKRGRPKLETPKRQVTLRLDADLVDHYRQMGRGWQSQINAALRKVAGV